VPPRNKGNRSLNVPIPSKPDLSSSVGFEQVCAAEILPQDVHRPVTGLRGDQQVANAGLAGSGDETRPQGMSAVLRRVESDPDYSVFEHMAHGITGHRLSRVCGVEAREDRTWLRSPQLEPGAQTAHRASVRPISPRQADISAAAGLILLFMPDIQHGTIRAKLDVIKRQFDEGRATKGRQEADDQQGAVSDANVGTVLCEQSAELAYLLNRKSAFLVWPFPANAPGAAQQLADLGSHRRLVAVLAVVMSDRAGSTVRGCYLAALCQQSGAVEGNGFRFGREMETLHFVAPALEHHPVMVIPVEGVIGVNAPSEAGRFDVQLFNRRHSLRGKWLLHGKGNFTSNSAANYSGVRTLQAFHYRRRARALRIEQSRARR
jgi:hypothetical protein